MHRLPEHRGVDPGRRRPDERRAGLRGEAAWRPRRSYVGTVGPAQRGPGVPHGLRRGTRTTCRSRGCCGWPWSAARMPTPRSTSVDRLGGAGDGGRGRGVLGRGPRVGGAAADGVAGDRGPQEPVALPAGDRQGPVSGRRRRRRRRDARGRSPRTRPRSSRVDYDPLPAVVDMRRGAVRRRPAGPRRVRHEPVVHWTNVQGTSIRVFAAAPVVVRERYKVHRLIANAMEPRSILVQPKPGRRAVHDVVLDADPAHPAHGDGDRHRDPANRSCGSSRRGVGGGFGSKLQSTPEEALGARARAPPPHADQVDRERGRRATWRRTTVATRSKTSSSRPRRTGRSSGTASASTRTWART